MAPRATWGLIFALGFFSGLPLALTGATLTAWLADAKVDRASIGLFAAVATPYALKFLWSPLMDGARLPWLTARLGRRRGWLVACQAALVGTILWMAGANPALNPWLTGLAGLAVATLSASQDIVIDAYRVERLAAEEQGKGAAWVTFGYRIGMLLSGAGALALADHVGWQRTYEIMAGVMALSLPLTLLAREPKGVASVENRESSTIAPSLRGGAADAAIQGTEPLAPSSGLPRSARNDGVFSSRDSRRSTLDSFFYNYVLAPLRDFMTRPYWVQVLLFVILYKLGDAFMGIMFNPFLLDLGFAKTQIAAIVKLYGLVATLVGTFAGGWLVARWGTYRTLLLCGVAHMLTNLLLVLQTRVGADTQLLAASISLENFSGGMASAAFIAYLSALCRVHYTATQYALLSSLAAFGRTWLSTPSGVLAKAVGWEWFFAIASLMALPGLALLVWLERKRDVSHSGPSASSRPLP